MKARIGNPRAAKWAARKARVARKVGAGDRVQLVVYRSARHIYAQLVDPESGRTMAGVSTRTPALAEGLSATGNVEAAKRVGKAIAELARARNVEKVVFNRNGFLYHGRVKALADAAREAGLQF
jgi:large subunit ribosomal protein L18